jgi:hypothetical protein
MPADEAPVTDSASAGVRTQRTASDHVGVEDSASAVAPPPLERSPERDRWQKNATEWVQEKWTTPNVCPICGSSTWTVTPPVSIYLYQGIAGIPSQVPAGVFPMFYVVCRTCAYAMSFSAVVAGVLPAPREPETPSAGTSER